MKEKHMYTTAIIAAAGSGTRMQSATSKLLLKLRDTPVLAMTLTAFDNASEIDDIIIVTREQDIQTVQEIASAYNITKLRDIVCGGDTRRQSISNALSHVSSELVLIHDGARPFISPEQINAVAIALHDYEAAAIGIPVTDTIKTTDGEFITGTIDRSSLVSIQTPQGFRTALIKEAHRTTAEKALNVTDDCVLCEAMGIKIKLIQGSASNIKLTTPADIAIAEGILARERRCNL